MPLAGGTMGLVLGRSPCRPSRRRVGVPWPGASRASAAADLPEGQRGRCGRCHWQLEEGRRPSLVGFSKPRRPRLRWRAPSGAAVPRRTPRGHGRRECGPGLSSGSMPGRPSGPESPGPQQKTRSLHSDHGARAVTGSERTLKSRASDAPIRLAGITQSAGPSLDGPVPRERCDDRPQRFRAAAGVSLTRRFSSPKRV
jgi:hypothetical protein